MMSLKPDDIAGDGTAEDDGAVQGGGFAPDGIPPVENVALDDSEPELGEPGAAPETPPDAETPAEPEVQPADDPQAVAQADIERRDRELLIRQAAVKGNEDKLRQFDDLQRMFRDDPGAALRALGIDPTRAAELALTGEKPAGPTIEEQIAELQKHNSDAATRAAEDRAAADVAAEKGRLAALIQENKEQLPTLAQWGEKGSERLHGAILAKVAPLVNSGVPLEDAVAQVLPKVPEIMTALESEVSRNVLTNIGRLLENQTLRDQLRAELDKADGAAPPKPGAPTAPTAAPSKGITNQMEGEHHATEQALTPEEADELGLDILKKAISAGTL